MKFNKIAIMLVIALITVTAGCLDYGDIGAVIDSWNEIIDKEDQITLTAEAIDTDYGNINYDNSAQSQRELQKINTKLNKMQQLLDEKSLLISEFAGTTVKVSDDANVYANEALSNIRLSQTYEEKQFSSLQKMNNIISNLIDISATINANNVDEKENEIKKLGNKIDIIDNEGTVNEEKANEYYNKAYDAIKKLEALQ